MLFEFCLQYSPQSVEYSPYHFLFLFLPWRPQCRRLFVRSVRLSSLNFLQYFFKCNFLTFLLTTQQLLNVILLLQYPQSAPLDHYSFTYRGSPLHKNRKMSDRSCKKSQVTSARLQNQKEVISFLPFREKTIRGRMGTLKQYSQPNRKQRGAA